MKTSKAGLAIIKKWEGCRLKAYQDSVGVWTIGYGLTSAAGIVPVVKGMTITQAQAEEYLEIALGSYEAGVIKAIKRPMTQPQFDAMVSLCYNIGPGAFGKSSLVRRFNEGNIAGAADAFLMWTKAGGKVLKGLENRRKDERALFLTAAAPQTKPVAPVPPFPAPIPPPPDIEPPAPLPVPPDAGTSIAAILLGAVGALVAALAAWIIGGR
jgi:GH24 family phage-related lysozyme (muramidase)